MAQLVAVGDYTPILGMVFGLIAGVCAAVVLMMRHRGSTRVVRELWCFGRQQNAVVAFAERTRDGQTSRSIVECSLRAHGETCGEGCRYLPFAAPRSVGT